MSKITEGGIEERLRSLSGWTRNGDAIRKEFVCDGFAGAVAFIVRIGFDAEAADHHPDVLLTRYKRVTLTFTTHSAGGLTEKDFAGAEAADRVFSGDGR